MTAHPVAIQIQMRREYSDHALCKQVIQEIGMQRKIGEGIHHNLRDFRNSLLSFMV